MENEKDEILDAEIIEQEETELSKLGNDFHAIMDSDESQSQIMSLIPFLMKAKDAKTVAEIAHKRLSPTLLFSVIGCAHQLNKLLNEFLNASEEINSFENLAKQIEETE
jgi:hypothetical protein